jgi:hypothetical protein
LTFGTPKEFVFLKSYGVIVFSMKEFIFSLFDSVLTILKVEIRILNLHCCSLRSLDSDVARVFHAYDVDFS